MWRVVCCMTDARVWYKKLTVERCAKVGQIYRYAWSDRIGQPLRQRSEESEYGGRERKVGVKSVA